MEGIHNNMTYELCKSLKDAGFPQKEGRYIREDGEAGGNKDALLRAGYVYDPTLSELIEACGDRFSHLIRQKLLHLGDKWWAFAYEDEENGGGYGSTPKIAVGRLLLCLGINKK